MMKASSCWSLAVGISIREPAKPCYCSLADQTIQAKTKLQLRFPSGHSVPIRGKGCACAGAIQTCTQAFSRELVLVPLPLLELPTSSSTLLPTGPRFATSLSRVSYTRLHSREQNQVVSESTTADLVSLPPVLVSSHS